MRKRMARRTVSLLVVLATASRASGQIPDKFTNLQVLPKDVPKAELVRTMRDSATALGVRCLHCHVGGNPETLEGFDFASDDKWEKRTARTMLRMVRVLNDDYVGRLEPRPVTAGQPGPAAVRVECITCHRGVARPETIDAVLSRVLAKDGPGAALKTYKDLRSQYLVRGSYDFSHVPLDTLAEGLLDQGRGREALPFLEMNVENDPSASWTLYLLGEARLAVGDRVEALQAFERSLALSPKNSGARKRIEELKAPPAPKP